MNDDFENGLGEEDYLENEYLLLQGVKICLKNDLSFVRELRIDTKFAIEAAFDALHEFCIEVGIDPQSMVDGVKYCLANKVSDERNKRFAETGLIDLSAVDQSDWIKPLKKVHDIVKDLGGEV